MATNAKSGASRSPQSEKTKLPCYSGFSPMTRSFQFGMLPVSKSVRLGPDQNRPGGDLQVSQDPHHWGFVAYQIGPRPCSSTSARSNGTTSFSTASTSSITPGSTKERVLMLYFNSNLVGTSSQSRTYRVVIRIVNRPTAAWQTLGGGMGFCRRVLFWGKI